MIKILQLFSGINEKVRPDLIDETELVEMVNCYNDQPGVLKQNDASEIWTDFENLNIAEPGSFFIWRTAKNISTNINDWFILCVSNNQLNVIYETDSGLTKLLFPEPAFDKPDYAVFRNQVFIVDNTPGCLMYLKVVNDQLELSPYAVRAPQYFNQPSENYNDHEIVDDTNNDLGMNIPKGSIIQYCYTYTDKDGKESNPSPITTFWLMQFIQDKKVWRKAKVNFNSYPEDVKQINLYRRENLYSESGAFSEFSLVAKLKEQTFNDVFPAVEFMEPSYEHDSNLFANKIAVSNNRIFLGNARRNSIFPFKFDYYCIIEVINNNNDNMINAWIRIKYDDLPEAVKDYILHDQPDYFRFYDTDRTTPCQILFLNTDSLFICIPYLQIGLNHNLFLAFGGEGVTDTNQKNIRYGQLSRQYNHVLVPQLIRNYNVQTCFDGETINGVNNLYNRGEYLYSIGSLQPVTSSVNQSYHKIESGIFNFNKNYIKFEDFGMGSLPMMIRDHRKSIIKFEAYINENGNEEVLSLILSWMVGVVPSYTLFNLTQINGIFYANGEQLNNEKRDYIRGIYSYHINLINGTEVLSYRFQIFIGTDLIAYERNGVLNLTTEYPDFRWSENLFLNINLRNHYYGQIYAQRDLFLPNNNFDWEFINNLPYFPDSYPTVTIKETKSTSEIDNEKGILYYSDESGTYFPEINKQQINSEIIKLCPEVNLGNNRINGILVFTKHNMISFELFSEGGKNLSLITNSIGIRNFKNSGIFQLDHDIYYTDESGIYSINSGLIPVKIQDQKYKDEKNILSFLPGKNIPVFYSNNSNKLYFLGEELSSSDQFDVALELIPFINKMLIVSREHVKLYPSGKITGNIKTKEFKFEKKVRVNRIYVNGSGSNATIKVTGKIKNQTIQKTFNQFNVWNGLGLFNVFESFYIEVINFTELREIKIDLAERG